MNTLKDITTTIKAKHPTSKIILSSLLPRTDSLNSKVIEINKTLIDNIKSKDTKIVQHNNISKTTDLKDKKHLNLKGVKMFAYNLKSAYFGNTRSNQSQKPKTTSTSRPNNHMDYPNATSFNPNFPPTTHSFFPQTPSTTYHHRNRTTHGSKMADNRNPFPSQLIELIQHLHRYVSN
jgi:hypothetical protein